MSRATCIVDSGNAKLGRGCATTYASIPGSCPATCGLRDSGCYAQGGRVGIHVRRLENGTALQVARDEARAIRAAIPRVKPGAPLRLHTAGDCRTVAAARMVAAAAREWPGPVWTYTHAWRDVPREAWGDSVSVLGSSERLTDALDAMARGYTPALVVDRHASARAFQAGGVRWIPCPAQTRPNVTCRDCRLCWNDKRPGAWGVTFAVHGQSSKRALKVLQ